MIEILTLIFAGVAATTPLFRRVWRRWLRFRWYRMVVALRENRSHTLVDLPDGIKMILAWVLHPVRRSQGRTTPTEHRIRFFVECPFYRPKHCVYETHHQGTTFGCEPNGSCYRLGVFSTDQDNPNDAAARQRRSVRARRSKDRPRRRGESPVPCSGLSRASGICPVADSRTVRSWPTELPAVAASSTSTEMPPDQPRHSFRHPQGAHNSVVGADQGFRAPSGDQESVHDAVHEDSASARIAAGQRPRPRFPAPTALTLSWELLDCREESCGQRISSKKPSELVMLDLRIGRRCGPTDASWDGLWTRPRCWRGDDRRRTRAGPGSLVQLRKRCIDVIGHRSIRRRHRAGPIYAYLRCADSDSDAVRLQLETNWR